MTIRLKQSTASQEVPLGVFVDETDGKTAETGLTIANTDIKLWKMGATSLANKYSPGRTNAANVFTVSAIDSLDDFAKFSNYGNCSLLKHLLISLKPLSPHQPSPPWSPRPVGVQLGMPVPKAFSSSNMVAISRAGSDKLR